MGRRAAAIVLLMAALGLVGCSRLGRLELEVKELKGNVKFLGERSDAASQANQALDASVKQAASELAAVRQSQAGAGQVQEDLIRKLDDLSQRIDGIRAQLARTQIDCCGRPVAAFTSRPAAQTESLTLSFVDRSQDSENDLVAWVWTFGDEGTADVQSPSHTYGAPGRYVVKLTVTDAKGCSSSAQQEISVPLPSASRGPHPAGQDPLGWDARAMGFPIACWAPKGSRQD